MKVTLAQFESWKEFLAPRERKILQLYYGIGVEPLSLREISEICNLSRERIRQVKERAVGRLRNAGLIDSDDVQT